MNLPPDKVKILSQYDNEKKWDLICDQVGVPSRFTAQAVTMHFSLHITIGQIKALVLWLADKQWCNVDATHHTNPQTHTHMQKLITLVTKGRLITTCDMMGGWQWTPINNKERFTNLFIFLKWKRKRKPIEFKIVPFHFEIITHHLTKFLNIFHTKSIFLSQCSKIQSHFEILSHYFEILPHYFKILSAIILRL